MALQGGGSTHCTALPEGCFLKGLLVRSSPQNLTLHMASLSVGNGGALLVVSQADTTVHSCLSTACLSHLG